MTTTLTPCPNYIGGEWKQPGGASTPVFNPSTGDVIAECPAGGAAEVNAAVEAAHAAFPAWRETPAVERARVFFRYRQLIEQNFDKLCATVSREHGKTLAEARGSIFRGLENIEYACGAPTLLFGDTLENLARSVDCETYLQPLGVCVGITPFNFPAMVPMWMYPLAIACGNTFVLKPSERDPSTTNLIAKLLAEAGLPDGVFNVVHGDKVAVDRLLDHPDVAAVSFVGSTPIARYVFERGTASGKRVQALGGAKNHMVVLPDADLELAADAAVSAGYGSAGERCMAISVVVAVGNVADSLVEQIASRSRAVKVGPGTESDSERGPLVTAAHLERVRGYVDDGVAAGAELVVDGRTATVPDRGFFLGPCLFDRVTPSMALYRDEIFGPVLSVVRVETYDEAVRLISENPYGNGVAIFTRDGGAARRFEHEVDAGMVGVNVPIPVPMAYYSFGGWKQSLFGDTHVHGTEGVHFYTRGKVVTTRWSDPVERGPDLGFPTTH